MVKMGKSKRSSANKSAKRANSKLSTETSETAASSTSDFKEPAPNVSEKPGYSLEPTTESAPPDLPEKSIAQTAACNSCVSAKKKTDSGSTLYPDDFKLATILKSLKFLDYNSKFYGDYTSVSGVVQDRASSVGNINGRSPVPIVGRSAAVELVQKMQKTKPPPLPQNSQPSSSKKQEKKCRGGSMDGLTSTDEKQLEGLLQSANSSLGKGATLKKYEKMMTQPEGDGKRREQMSHCSQGHEKIVCRQCTEINPPKDANLINFHSSSFDASRMFSNAQTSTADASSTQSCSGHRAASGAEFLNLNPDNSKYSTELMLDSVLEYLQLERLNVVRQFVSCKKQRMRLVQKSESISQKEKVDDFHNSGTSNDTKTERGGSNKRDAVPPYFDIEEDLLNLSVENSETPSSETDLKSVTERTLKYLAKLLYKREYCICKEDFYSRLHIHNITSQEPSEGDETADDCGTRPCLCKLLYTNLRCTGCCCANSKLEPESQREQLLSESTLHHLCYKIKTACEVFPRKRVDEVLQDREFQLIAKKWSKRACLEEYKREEKRVRREKRERANEWAVKKADIESKIDNCLHVMEWARENEEFMLDHATDEEREFLASVLIRGNGLIKSAKELSNDKESLQVIAKASQTPPVDASEMDLERVELNARKQLRAELPKLIELFEMKHILSYFHLW